MRLTLEMKEMVERLRICYVATVTPDGKPDVNRYQADARLCMGCPSACRRSVPRNWGAAVARNF